MAINIYDHYSPRATAPNADFPAGSVLNRSAPGEFDGTPLDEALFNDYVGFTAALLARGGISPSGNADTALSSDRLKSIIGIVMNETIGALYNTECQEYAAGVVVNTSRKLILRNKRYNLLNGTTSRTMTGNWLTDQTYFTELSFSFPKLEKATTSLAGVVVLNNTLTSTDTTQAATAATVKIANDNANSRAPAVHSHTGTQVSAATLTARGTVQLDNTVSFEQAKAATPLCVKSAYDRAGPAGHVHTSTQIGAATAGLTVGSVGSYVYARTSQINTGVITYGFYYQGSSLYHSGVSVFLTGDQNQAGVGTGGQLSGTWMAMGSCAAAGSSRYASTLFLRIS